MSVLFIFTYSVSHKVVLLIKLTAVFVFIKYACPIKSESTRDKREKVYFEGLTCATYDCHFTKLM